jgi:hypothetical protein
MGFLDRIKKFTGGKNTATVEVTDVAGLAPGVARIKLSDKVIMGSMRVSAQEDCTILATKYEVILRTKDESGEWSDVIVSDGKDKEEHELSVGESFDVFWRIDDVDIAQYLRCQEWSPNEAVDSDSVKLVINCIADVKGSPFDPSGEAEVAMAPQDPMQVEITKIEGMPADASYFPVGDSVLKGTVVVTASEEGVLAATKYEVCLRLDGKDVLVAGARDPELEPDSLSVSFGGTYIEFPLQMKPGKQATHTWMVSDIDLPRALASNGFTDASSAVTNESVELVVRCLAEIEGQPGAVSETVVALR